MATIATTFKAVDQISPALKKITSSMGGVISSSQKVSDALNGINPDEIDSIGDAAKTADKALEDLADGAKGADQAIDGISGKSIDTVAGSAKSADSALDGLESGAKGASQAVNSVDSSKIGGVTGAAKEADSAIDGLSDSAKEASKSLDSVEQATKKLQTAGGALKGIGSALSSIGKVGSIVTGALTGVMASAFNTSKNFIKLYESSQVVFKQMLGGEEAAKKMYTSLLDIAKASTFSQEAFLNAGKSLVGVGVSAENTTKYLQAISDAVTGFGGDAQDIEQITNAFRKVSTNGKLSMEEVNMMADANINVLKILGNQYGVSTEEMREMISSGAVPAEEALGKLTDGIEKGTDGVNGMTQAMEGMSKAMKGKTLTGALDSMNSSIRSFSLNLLAMNPTLKESDEGYAENQKRISQLTAAITKINTIIEKSVPLFKGMTDGIGALLDKLIGTQPVFNEATGTWEQTGGILTEIQNVLEQTDPDKLARLGNVFLSVGGAAPVLLGAGKAINNIGSALDSLSKKKEILTKVFNAFSAKPKQEDDSTKETQATQTQKKTKSSLSLPNLSAPFKTYIDKIKSFGTEVSAATDSAATTSTNAMKQSFGRGISNFMASIKDSFDAGKENVDVGGFFSNLRAKFNTGVDTFGNGAKIAVDKNGLLINTALSSSLDQAGNGGFIKNTFSKLTQATDTESASFGQKFKTSITNAIPQGDTLFDKFKNSVTNFGSALGNTAQVAGGALKKLIPNNFLGFISGQLQKALGLFGKLPGAIGKMLGPVGSLITKFLGPLSGLFGNLAGIVTQAFSAITSALAPVLSFLEPIILAITSLSSSFLGIGTFAGAAVAGIGAIVGALGILNKDGLASQAVDNFFSGFNSKISEFGQMAVTGIHMFVSNLIANFPTLVQQGAQLIVSLVTGLLTTLPNLISTGAVIVINLVTGIIQSLPSLIAGGFQAIQAVATGIGQNAPSIWNSIQSALGNIYNAITTNLPLILESGKQIINNLISGIAQLIPQLWNWGVTAITGLWTFITTQLPGFIQSGCELLKNFISGIVQTIPVLLTTGLSLIGSFISTIWENRGQILQVGGQLLLSLITGILSLTGTLISALLQVGSAIVQGLWDGINAVWASFTGWLGGIFGGLIDTVKGIFGVASPSTIFASIGGFLIEGLKNGVEAVWNSVSGIFQGIADTVISFFQPKDQVDYTEMIAQTEAQINELKAKVQAGYEELKNLTIANNQQMAANTIAIFGAMTGAVLAQVALLVAQTTALIAIIPATFTATFSALLVTTIGYLEALKVATIAQIVSLIGSMQGPLAQISLVFVSVFAQINAQTLAFFTTLQALAVSSITALISVIGASLMGLSAVFLSSFNAMVTGALAALELLRVGVVAKIAQIKDETSGSFYEMESSIVGSLTTFKDDAIGIFTELADRARELISSMVSDLQRKIDELPPYFRSAGESMISELRSGIESKTQEAIDATSKLVQSLKDTFIKGLGIHSPSRFMAYVGEMMAAGLMGGLNKSQLGEFAKNTLEDIVSAFENGKFNAAELVDFLGHDSLKVIEAIQADPELAKRASVPGMGVAGGASSIVDAARKYVGYRSDRGNNGSIFNDRLGAGAGAWCAMFVKAMADEAGVFFPNIYYVPGIYDWAHANGRWSTTPQIGDAVIYGGGKGHHIEIVSGVNSDGSVTSIGGNTGLIPGVYEHTRRDINGFVRLDGSSAAAGSNEQIAYPLIGTKGTQTSWFGPRASPGGIGSTNHGGVDLAAPTGTPIAAALAGNVSIAGWYGGYGNAVKVDSGNIEIIYGHMSQILASQGQQVGKGQQIGLVGSTGNSTGPHLHFEMHQNGQRIDPQPFIDGSAISVGSGGYGLSLIDQIRNAYNQKYGTNLALSSGVSAASMNTAGSGLVEPTWFQAWTPSPAVAKWAPYASQALQILGEPQSLLKGVLWAIEGESGGDPNCINTWDYNARIGDPTKGLLQIMMANFKPRSQGGWGVEGYTSNIYDPLSNILTGLGEMKWKPNYASQGGIAGVINKRLRAGHWSGYAVGTRKVPEDMLAMIHEGEAILPKSQNPYSESGGNYLKEIGDTIGIEVLKSTMDFDALPQYYPQYFDTDQIPQNNPNESNINYRQIGADMEQGRMISVSANSGSASPITIEVNIGTVNNSGDLDNIEDQVVVAITNAINRADKATGAVGRVY